MVLTILSTVVQNRWTTGRGMCYGMCCRLPVYVVLKIQSAKVIFNWPVYWVSVARQNWYGYSYFANHTIHMTYSTHTIPVISLAHLLFRSTVFSTWFWGFFLPGICCCKWNCATIHQKLFFLAENIHREAEYHVPLTLRKVLRPVKVTSLYVCFNVGVYGFYHNSSRLLTKLAWSVFFLLCDIDI